MQELVTDLLGGKNVVFITGAGLSTASGVPPYRQTSNATWSTFVEEWGTRQRFLENPVKWWNTFWLTTHETPELLAAAPNDGHVALARLADRCANVRVVTQNIDTLHSKTMADASRLIEVHGHLGLYKCTSTGCENANVSLTREDIRLDELLDGTGTSLTKAPVCPSCEEPVLPQALLFDEKYDCHPYYQWERAIRWMERAHTIVFVGTSFSVGITRDALDIAFQSSKQVFNFNVGVENLQFSGVGEFAMQDWFQDTRLCTHVIGRCESTIPLLTWTTDRVAALRRSIREMSGEPAVPDVKELDGVFCEFASGKREAEKSGAGNGAGAGGTLFDDAGLGLETAEMEVGAALAVLGTPQRGGRSFTFGMGGKGKGKGKRGKARRAAGAGARAATSQPRRARAAYHAGGAIDNDATGAYGGPSDATVRAVHGSDTRVLVNLAKLPQDVVGHLRGRLKLQAEYAAANDPAANSLSRTRRRRRRPPPVPDMLADVDDGAASSASDDDGIANPPRVTRRRLSTMSSATRSTDGSGMHIQNPSGMGPADVSNHLPDVSPSGAAMLLAGFGQQARVGAPQPSTSQW